MSVKRPCRPHFVCGESTTPLDQEVVGFSILGWRDWDHDFVELPLLSFS